MSGIAGVLYFDARPPSEIPINEMANRLAHRGCDGAGFWRTESVGLTACQFTTTPEARSERQPCTDPHSRCVLVADARLDNRDELLPKLGLSGSDSPAISDSDLILQCWLRWGELCVDHLLGDFAFALWDVSARRFFCARDHAGVRPFFYYASPRLFAFASEIKALHALPEVPRHLNELKIGDFLVEHFEYREITFYQDIYRLPPAHILTAARGSTQVRAYWQFDCAREIRLRTDGDYIDGFREVFTNAVRCRLRANGPVASHLSGGLDSSSITCVARRLLSSQSGTLHSLSAIFPTYQDTNPQIDERRYIDSVTHLNGLVHHAVHADRISPLLEPLWGMDEWICIPNVYMDWGLCGAARDQGIRTVLSGHDGDCVVTYGYQFLSYLALTGRWLRLLRESRALCRRRHSSLARFVWNFGFRPVLPDSVLKAAHWLRGTPRPTNDVMARSIIHPEFARGIGIKERLASYSTNERRFKYSFREQHARGMPGGLDLYGLEFFNQMGAMQSVEPRFPFYDRRLMEYCLGIPHSLKLRDGQSRWIFRRAMEGILPELIVNRSDKGDLSANFQKRFLCDGRDLIEEALFRNHALIEKYINLPLVRDEFRKYAADPMAQRSPSSINVFTAVSLYLWLRTTQLRP